MTWFISLIYTLTNLERLLSRKALGSSANPWNLTGGISANGKPGNMLQPKQTVGVRGVHDLFHPAQCHSSACSLLSLNILWNRCFSSYVTHIFGPPK